MPDISRASAVYQETLLKMAELSGDKGAVAAPRSWNRLVNRLETQRLVLSMSEAGRAVVSALLDHPRPTVRLWAAAAALRWDEQRARQVLETLRDSPAEFGLHATSARYTLTEYDAGRLR
jgi:hypothetical protein